jgi:hypothetical protein
MIKYIIIPLLILTGCTTGVQLGKKVRVTDGLFKGCTGILSVLPEGKTTSDGLRIYLDKSYCPHWKIQDGYAIFLFEDDINNLEEVTE